ncbi:MAG: DUF4124 domain-containing protein [Gammaproteobacteria bacterium]|nr:DUF4124 domain-containing protein [Gammaproteobacteria bacterium]
MNYKLTLLFIFVYTCSLPVHAKMYKWVDDEGVVHFGDTIPAKYLNKERKELNSQGSTVKVFPAAETVEQRKERLKLEQEEKRKKKIIQEQAKQDKVLLDTYTTERDLIAARTARLVAVDSQLKLSESIIDDAKRKLDLTEKQITRLRADGKEVPQNILDKMQREEKQLEIYQNVAANHQKRKQEINKQFTVYIERFRELKADQKRIKEEREARRREALGL